MRTYDIIVAIHQTRKMGDKKKFGPDSLDQWGAAAGVSGLSSQSAALNLARRLPDGWGIENEGSSYEFNTRLAGRRMTNRSRSMLMHDLRPYHGPAGKAGSCNYLFADGRVDDWK